MRILLLIISAVSIGFLSGCATTFTHSGALYSDVRISPDNATIIVFRNDYEGRNGVPHLYIDDVKYADIPHMGFATAYLAPGIHKLEAKWPISPKYIFSGTFAPLTLEVMKGEVKYFTFDTRQVRPSGSVVLGVRSNEGYFRELPTLPKEPELSQYREVEYF